MRRSLGLTPPPHAPTSPARRPILWCIPPLGYGWLRNPCRTTKGNHVFVGWCRVVRGFLQRVLWQHPLRSHRFQSHGAMWKRGEGPWPKWILRNQRNEILPGYDIQNQNRRSTNESKTKAGACKPSYKDPKLPFFCDAPIGPKLGLGPSKNAARPTYAAAIEALAGAAGEKGQGGARALRRHEQNGRGEGRGVLFFFFGGGEPFFGPVFKGNQRSNHNFEVRCPVLRKPRNRTIPGRRVGK